MIVCHYDSNGSFGRIIFTMFQDSHVELSHEEIARYSRHLTLPEIGIEGQKKLKSASVLCIGTGGLGSPLLMYLAAAGIGTLGIVDYDNVDKSNLQRQIIHSDDTVGMQKTESAKQRINSLNPNCCVKTYNQILTSQNALEIIEPYDIVCDGTDNFPTRYLVNDACVILQKPNIYGSVFRFEGQASVFNLTANSPNYRDLVPEPPPPGVVPSCAEGGVMGIVPGIIGLIQATETIKIITGVGQTLDKRLLIFDSLKMKFREMALRSDPNTSVITKLIDYKEFCGLPKDSSIDEEAGTIDTISVFDLQKLLNHSSEKICIIDVRSEQEYDIVHLEHSILIPLQSIESGESLERVRELARDNKVVCHCKLGGRSAKAVIALQRFGILASNLAGGIDAWAKDIDQTMIRY